MTDALFQTPAVAVAPVAATAGTDPVNTHALGVLAGALPVAPDPGDGSDTSSAALRGEARPAEPVLCSHVIGPPTGAGAGPAGGETAIPVAEPAGPAITIDVFGQPAPQGSKHGRPIYRGRGTAKVFTGKVALVESSANVQPWREAVKHAALDVMKARHATSDPFWILDGPLFIYTVYSFIRPAAHYRTGRNAHLLRDSAPAYPTGKNRNDIEKLDRATRDALTDAGVWVDDSLVVHHDSWKVYAGQHLDALPVAGAHVRIYRITDLSASPSATSPGR